MKIVLPDFIEITDAEKSNILALGNVTIYDDLPKDTESLVDRIKDAEIITANYVDITSSIIDGAPNLKYIIVPAVGYEWVDTPYARSKNITVVNCPTYNSQAVAEHALALLFAVSRHIPSANNSLKKGDWRHGDFIGSEVSGKSLGLIGHGNVGNLLQQLYFKRGRAGPVTEIRYD